MPDDLQTGLAGEHLVCADLLRRGYSAFVADQSCPFDVVAVIGGRTVRFQVKTTRTFRSVPQRKKDTPAYMFHIRRVGKGGRRQYQPGDFDVMALVALDSGIIGYRRMSETRSTMHIRKDGLAALKLEDALCTE